MQDSINTTLNQVLAGSGSALSGQTNASPLRLVIPGTPGGESDAGSSAPSNFGALAETIGRNTAELAAVNAAVQNQLDSIADNTKALVDNTTTHDSSGAGVGKVVSNVAGNILGGGLLGPIASGLMHLFGDSDTVEAPAPLVKFALPSSVNVGAGVSAAGTSAVDYGQNDQPRAAASAPQVTVNVSTIDSRSFMDHSNEIASAVRRAILESNALNDVLGDM